VADTAPNTESSGDKPIEKVSIENQVVDPATPLFKVRSFSLLFITRVTSTTDTI
jgi:hypothetical protein